MAKFLSFLFLLNAFVACARADSLSQNNVPTTSPIAQEEKETVDTSRDVPLNSVVVHNPKFALAKRWLIVAGPTMLNGDKFLTTFGGGIEGFRFWREQWAWSVGAYGFSSKATDNAGTLAAAGRAPIAYDPSWIGTGALVFAPLYGKFALGGRIIHFKLLLNAGIHLAHEVTSSKVQSTRSESNMNPGAQLGTGVFFPLSEHFLLSGRFQALMRKKMLSDESGLRRNFLYGVQLGYNF